MSVFLIILASVVGYAWAVGMLGRAWSGAVHIPELETNRTGYVTRESERRHEQALKAQSDRRAKAIVWPLLLPLIAQDVLGGRRDRAALIDAEVQQRLADIQAKRDEDIAEMERQMNIGDQR